MIRLPAEALKKEPRIIPVKQKPGTNSLLVPGFL